MLNLVCGAGGMLGKDLVIALNERGCKVVGLTRHDLDITDFIAVRSAIKKAKPDVVINASAYTNVDGCESKSDLAYQVNALGPRNLAIASTEVGASLVQISTNYVFDGLSNIPYREYDPVNPISVYGKTKLDGEFLVRSLCSRHYIVRTAWLFGLGGRNFVNTILGVAEKRTSIEVVNDQVGSPTYSWDLANAIVNLLERPTYGTYNLTNSGNCSWFEFTQEILRQAGLEKIELKSISSEELARPALRPKYSVLDNYIWRLEGQAPLRPYQEALADYLSHIKA